jgi:cytochrome d ubiquinol oxidase subunit II
MDLDTVLPVLFWLLMGMAMLIYVALDGYDLGVGMLLPLAKGDAERDRMVASIGPFWDANETWLVLGVGILLIAFPKAHGVIVGALYIPVAVMLLGLILRGVAFDFRIKAHAQHKPLWNAAFFAGSLMASLSQGWMLGRYITGLHESPMATAFAAGVMLALPITYLLLGACWLILKMEDRLQQRAVAWAKLAWPGMVLALALVSVATPLVSDTVRGRWFSMPNFLALLPVPLMTGVALVGLRGLLNSHRIVGPQGKLCWLPLLLALCVLVLGAFGMAYSLYPYVLLDQLTVWQVASDTSSLAFILVGVSVAVPAIIGYTVFVYKVFGGKTGELTYGWGPP